MIEEPKNFPGGAPAVEKVPKRRCVTGESSADNDRPYVTWDSPDDPENPVNWSKTRKWILSGIGFGFLTLVGTSISAYAISQPSLESALHISHFTGTLGVIIFTITFGGAPLVLAPFSELFGRSPVYIASAIVFWLMFLPQALAKNFATELVTRFVSGIGASTSVAVVGGILADIWETHERGLPMAIFSLLAFVGTGLGPVAFGYVELALGYKYINWIMFGITGLFTLALIMVAKETRASVLLIRKAARLRAETGDLRYRAKAEEERSSIATMVKISLTRPLWLLFTEPVLFAYTIWITYAWGILYLMLEAIPLVFTKLYGFNAGENGLVFMGQIIGPILGLGYYQCPIAKPFYKSTDSIVLFFGAGGIISSAVNVWCDPMFSGLALPIGCWIYTWTSWTGVHWVLPVLGICVIYAAMFGVYLACFNYIADSYTIYASSALSGQSCIRLVVGAMFSLLAEPMYDNLGIHLAGSVLAVFSSVFAVTPFILYRYGGAIRARSSFAKHLASLEDLRLNA